MEKPSRPQLAQTEPLSSFDSVGPFFVESTNRLARSPASSATFIAGEIPFDRQVTLPARPVRSASSHLSLEAEPAIGGGEDDAESPSGTYAHQRGPYMLERWLKGQDDGNPELSIGSSLLAEIRTEWPFAERF